MSTITEVLDLLLGVPATTYESELRYVLGVIIIIFMIIVIFDIIYGAVKFR
jgi:hypothetical protein